MAAVCRLLAAGREGSTCVFAAVVHMCDRIFISPCSLPGACCHLHHLLLCCRYAAGDQVLLCYGKHTNLELLEHYGFVLQVGVLGARDRPPSSHAAAGSHTGALKIERGWGASTHYLIDIL